MPKGAGGGRDQSLRLPPLPPGERPDVEVRGNDAWWPGEIRSWSPSPSGWWANCSWHRTTGETRPDTVDGVVRREVCWGES